MLDNAKQKEQSNSRFRGTFSTILSRVKIEIVHRGVKHSTKANNIINNDLLIRISRELILVVGGCV